MSTISGNLYSGGKQIAPLISTNQVFDNTDANNPKPLNTILEELAGGGG